MQSFLINRTLTFKYYLFSAIFSGLLVSSEVAATPPLNDQIVIEGKSHGFFQIGESWLPIPRNKALFEIMRNERCSAIGGPVGKWKISRHKLYLTGFYKCGGDITLNNIYPSADSPILATWLFGDYFYNHGKIICFTGMFESVSEFRTTLHVKNGKILSSRTEPNNGVNFIIKKNDGDSLPQCEFIKR